MKATIYNRGTGWYITATNYKNKEDKTYISVFFPNNSDPMYVETKEGYDKRVINIAEGKFTSYKGKAGLTVFKYSEVNDDNNGMEQITRKQDNGGGGYAEIKANDLPFY